MGCRVPAPINLIFPDSELVELTSKGCQEKGNKNYWWNLRGRDYNGEGLKSVYSSITPLMDGPTSGPIWFSFCCPWALPNLEHWVHHEIMCFLGACLGMRSISLRTTSPTLRTWLWVFSLLDFLWLQVLVLQFLLEQPVVNLGSLSS